MDLDTQRAHYRQVRQRINQNTMRKYDTQASSPVRPRREPEPSPAPLPTARMRVPTAEEITQQLAERDARIYKTPSNIRSSDPQAEAIVKRVCMKHRVPMIEVFTANRTPAVVACRVEAIVEVWLALQWPMTRLGKFFNKDHSTVNHHIHAYLRNMRNASTEAPDAAASGEAPQADEGH